MNPEIISSMMECNVCSLTILTRLIVPHMLKQDYGKILNVASTAGLKQNLYF